ncbi:hypothetical protein bcere0018_31830 [Bacillus cereus Rock1-15]|nr:hypothetical protein bcere0018_31830 [Bacillus cereus Rock1-15]
MKNKSLNYKVWIIGFNCGFISNGTINECGKVKEKNLNKLYK